MPDTIPISAAEQIKHLLSKNGVATAAIDPSQIDLEAARRIVQELSTAENIHKRAFEADVIAALALLKDESPGDYSGAVATLKALKVSQPLINNALKKHESKLRAVEQGEKRNHLAGDFLDDAPLPDLIIPDKYRLHADKTTVSGFSMMGFTEEVVAHGAILITGRTRDIDGENEGIRLSWKRGGAWRHRIVDRGVIANKRGLVELANFGFPVTTGNADAQIEYFAKAEAENFNLLPVAQTTSHLGWQGHRGDAGFLVGREFIQPDGESIEAVTRADSMEWAGGITFRGASAGDEQVTEGYIKEGTLAGWIDAIGKITKFPRVLTTVYTSFVPPMLSILDCPNFILDLCSRTSQGKTSTQRAAASVWGSPDERKPGSALQTWDTTTVGIERMSVVLGGIPLILDDTKRAKDVRVIANALYLVSSGRGRVRGDRVGLAAARTWHTVLISSGEQPATSFSNDGGTKMRTLEIQGAPFGKQDIETGKIVEAFNLGILANYGHAGPEFVRWVMMRREQWPAWKAEFRAQAEAYIKAAGNERAGRLATYAAAIYITAKLVHEALSLPWEFDDPIETLWREIASEADDPLNARRALRYLVSWAHSNESRFIGRAMDARVPPSGGWLGRWDRGDKFGFIAIYPHQVESLLTEQKYNPESILGEWRERGWLVIKDTSRKRYTSLTRVRAKENPVQMIAISRAAIDEIDGEDGIQPLDA